jgi:hypothetical protein
MVTYKTTAKSLKTDKEVYWFITAIDKNDAIETAMEQLGNKAIFYENFQATAYSETPDHQGEINEWAFTYMEPDGTIGKEVIQAYTLDTAREIFFEIMKSQNLLIDVISLEMNNRISVNTDNTLSMKTENNPLLEANEIINNRSEEKERMYGPIDEAFERAAMIFNGWTGLECEPEHVYKMLIALKMSRESYNKKYDNILDGLAYWAALYNHYKSDYDKTK